MSRFFVASGISVVLNSVLCLIGYANGEQPALRAELAVKTQRVSKTAEQLAWDFYKYPLVRWKSHPITTIPGATAQLSTTFNSKKPEKDIFDRGLLRYTLMVSQSPNFSSALTVQLLDANGFKLTEFQVAREKFHPLPGTLYLEAADDHPCTKREYKLARDYVVM